MKKKSTSCPQQCYGNAKTCYQICMIILCLIFTFSGCKKIDTQSLSVGAVPNSKLADKSVTGDEFTIAVIPDTQYYTAEKDNPTHGGKQQMFADQISWIISNKTTENIVYVVGLGDISDSGDLSSGNPYIADEWTNASTNGGYYLLDTAGIPYGLAVGNHDRLCPGAPHGDLGTATTNNYNAKFGVSHFTGRSYYGDHYSSNNDSHYDFFSAGGINFIVIYVEYNLTQSDWTSMNTWVYNTLVTYGTRKAIIVTHYVGGSETPSNFGPQAAALYAKIKTRRNVFLFLGGHVDGVGTRQDTYNGRTIKSFISDYQFYTDKNGNNDGGGGYMRLIKVSVANDLMSVRTISPYLQNRVDTAAKYIDSTERFAYDQHFTRSLFHEAYATRTCDFAQDGKSDFGFWDASTGNWNINGLSTVNWGQSGDIPCPADYHGAGKTEYAVFRPSNHKFYVEGQASLSWGLSGDIPVPADYNGDGKADYALYRPSNFTWYMKNYVANRTTYAVTYTDSSVVYGAAGDIPVPGNYLGDGHIRVAMYRPSTFEWWIKGQGAVVYGTTNDVPVPGDYNGDGKTDIAVYRRITTSGTQGNWYIINADGTDLPNITAITAFQSGDIPAPGDYDGLGRTQPAVYRPSTHTLYIGHWGSFSSTTIQSVTSVVLNEPGKLINLPYAIRQPFGF